MTTQIKRQKRKNDLKSCKQKKNNEENGKKAEKDKNAENKLLKSKRQKA